MLRTKETRMARRYEEEIEDILKQAGEIGSVGPTKRRKGFFVLLLSYVTQSVGGRNWSITPGRIILTAAALLLVGLLLQSSIPGIGALMAWGGLALFIVGYAMFFIRPRKFEKRWRGQPIDDSGEKFWDRLRRRGK